jgi:hypothetical protein
MWFRISLITTGTFLLQENDSHSFDDRCFSEELCRTARVPSYGKDGPQALDQLISWAGLDPVHPAQLR